MKRTFIITVLLMLSALVMAQTYKVALLETLNGDKAVAVKGIEMNMVRGELRKAITNQSGYQAFTRTDIDQLMAEHNFQNSGLVDDSQIKRLGEMSSADYICVSTLTKSDTEFYLEAYLIDVETGEISNTVTQYGVLEGGSLANLYVLCKLLSNEMIGNVSDVDKSMPYNSVDVTISDDNQEPSSEYSELNSRYYDWGVEKYNNGDYKDAMEYFQMANDAAIEMGTNDDAAMMNISYCAMHLGNYEVVASTCEQLLSKGFEDVSIYSCLINAYRGLGRYDESLYLNKKAIAKYPEDQQLANDMINTYLTLNRAGEIVDLLESMAGEYTNQPIYYFILGTVYGDVESNLFNADKALWCYDKVIAADNSYIDAYYNAGALLIELASNKYSEASDKDPSDYTNFNSYLKATDDLAAQAKSYDQRALPYLEKCYKYDPDDAAVKQALQGIYNRLKINKHL